jgi:predicted RNA-binding Zn ribbon-like protein
MKVEYQTKRKSQRAAARGRLAIQFANTIAKPMNPRHGRGWAALIGFLEEAGVVGPAEAARLRALGRDAPSRCAGAAIRALELRAVIRQILDAMAQQRPLAAEWIEVVNRALRADGGTEQLVAAGSGWRLTFVPERHDPLVALSPPARSAAELIVEGPTAPVRRCANPKCVLFFYDDSRSHRRRWCSMAACGNRMKVAAHAQRRQSRFRSPTS